MSRLLLVLLILSGCTGLCERTHEDFSPEEVVEAYLNVALNMASIEQKEELLKFTTGALNESIATAADDTIKEAYIDKNYDLDRYSVVERRDRTPRETEITFELVYREFGPNRELNKESTPLVTNENIVSVVKEKGVWRIKDVLNKKSSFDFPTAMGSTIKAKSP